MALESAVPASSTAADAAEAAASSSSSSSSTLQLEMAAQLTRLVARNERLDAELSQVRAELAVASRAAGELTAVRAALATAEDELQSARAGHASAMELSESAEAAVVGWRARHEAAEDQLSKKNELVFQLRKDAAQTQDALQRVNTEKHVALDKARAAEQRVDQLKKALQTAGIAVPPEIKTSSSSSGSHSKEEHFVSGSAHLFDSLHTIPNSSEANLRRGSMPLFAPLAATSMATRK